MTAAKEDFYTHYLEYQHITKFARGLNKQQKRCKDDFIYEIPDAEKVRFFLEEFSQCGVFDDKEMTKYEAKLTEQKTWDNTTNVSFPLYEA